MTNYEKLLIQAEKIGIKVLEKDLGTDKECGYYINGKIVINNRITDKQKYCVLVEELGHYYTTHGNILDQTKIENRKKELIARRWGHQNFVSIIGIVEAFEYGAKTLYEMAEFLGVTEKYLLESLEEYKKKYGAGYKLEQYYVRFEPTLGIYKTFCPVK